MLYLIHKIAGGGALILYNNNNEMSGYSLEDSLFILKKYSKFENTKTFDRPKLIYDIDSRQVKLFKGFFSFPYSFYLRSEIEKIKYLINNSRDLFSYKSIYHTEASKYDIDSLSMIKLAQDNKFYFNDYSWSLLYAQMMLSLGFEARLVECLPIDFAYRECKYVVEVFIRKTKKWIAIDPVLDQVFYDDENNLLNLLDIRNRIVEDKIILVNRPSEDWHTHRIDLNVWTRYSFRYKFHIKNTIDMQIKENPEFAMLNPQGFIMKDRKNIQNNYNVTSYRYYYNSSLFW